MPGSARARELARWGELVSMLLCQLIPHFLIAISVMTHPNAFFARVRGEPSAAPPLL